MINTHDEYTETALQEKIGEPRSLNRSLPVLGYGSRGKPSSYRLSYFPQGLPSEGDDPEEQEVPGE